MSEKMPITQEARVTNFHLKHGFPVAEPLDQEINEVTQRLQIANATSYLEAMSKDLQTQADRMLRPALLLEGAMNDHRMYRIHLILGEVAELCKALADKDIVAVADATGDLRYVAVGTDVTYGIPSSQVDREIHRSNMTKQVRNVDCNPRMLDKGSEYKEPRLEELLGVKRKND